MNYDAFSHGQIKSKLWLCEKLEPQIQPQSNTMILGCWYNILGFMMLTRNPYRYRSIVGIDTDQEAIDIADKVLDRWIVENRKVHNMALNANALDYTDMDTVINCSSEHMESNDWFDKIPEGTLVCIQSSNVTETGEPWFIKNPSPTLESFTQKYNLSKTHFADTLRIDYGSWGYDRFMLIGIK
jgi:hypothetical protein